MSITPALPEDLCAARASTVPARERLNRCIESARGEACRHAFVATRFDAARAECDAAASDSPLRGLAVSVKDLFDIAGETTAAASRALADAPPASVDAPAVARLRAAGAAIIGRTNMTEFAFSGVGINPHHGTPVNPATLALDSTARIPGGSTSGGAVSVAAGAAWAALGSDTGGSIRIPAALQGLVGFKNTARLTPADGAIPLSTTLDTVCAITRSARDAVLMHELLAARRVALSGKPIHAWRFAVPTTVMLDALEPPVAQGFEHALRALSRAGAQVVERALPSLAEISGLNARGTLSAAESWAWHRELLSRRGAEYDPRVAARIRAGESMSAADYLDLLAGRRAWIARTQAAIDDVDALLSPTVPIVAPPIEPLVASDDAFFATNATLLRNPSVANFLDGCAITLPCHAPGEWPAGLMLWHGALHDDALLDAALAVEQALAGSAR